MSTFTPYASLPSATHTKRIYTLTNTRNPRCSNRANHLFSICCVCHANYVCYVVMISPGSTWSHIVNGGSIFYFTKYGIHGRDFSACLSHHSVHMPIRFVLAHYLDLETTRTTFTPLNHANTNINNSISSD